MRITQRCRAAMGAAALVGMFGASGCQTWTSGMTLPSGYYLRHTPQYFQADPTFPLPRELASQEDPAGAAIRAGAPGVGPALVAPAQPVEASGAMPITPPPGAGR